MSPIGKHNQKLIVKLHHHKLDKTTKTTHNDITWIDNVPPFWAIAMDKGNIHGIAIFLAQHEKEHTWTINVLEVWTIYSNIFHKAYHTQN